MVGEYSSYVLLYPLTNPCRSEHCMRLPILHNMQYACTTTSIEYVASCVQHTTPTEPLVDSD